MLNHNEVLQGYSIINYNHHVNWEQLLCSLLSFETFSSIRLLNSITTFGASLQNHSYRCCKFLTKEKMDCKDKGLA